MGQGQFVKWFIDEVVPLGPVYVFGAIVLLILLQQRGINVLAILRRFASKSNGDEAGKPDETSTTKILRQHEAETFHRELSETIRDSMGHLEETTTTGLGEIRDEVGKINGTVREIKVEQTGVLRRIDEAEVEIKDHGTKIGKHGENLVELNTYRKAAEKAKQK